MLYSKLLRHSIAAFVLSLSVSASSQISVGHSDLTYEAGSWDLTDTEFVCGGSVRYTAGDPGAQVSLKFRGTGIGLYLPRAPEGASIEVDIDGQKVTLDTHMRIYDCNTPIYVVSDLAFKQHTVKVKTLDNGTLYVSKFVYDVPDIPSEEPAIPSVVSTTPATAEEPHPRNMLPVIVGVSSGVGAALLGVSVWIFFMYRRLHARDRALKANIEAANTETAKNAIGDFDAQSIHSIEKVGS